MVDQLIRGTGQKPAIDSLPVVLASDQPAIPVTVTSGGGGAPVPPADGGANTTASAVGLLAFNGTTWDRVRAGLSTVSAVLTGMLNTLPWGLYHAVPVSRTEGQGGPVETDIKGNMRVAEQAPPAYENVPDASASTHDKPAASAAYNAIGYDAIAKSNAGVIKAAPGNLYRLYVTNDNAAAQYYALVNKATTPANGDTPIMYFKIQPGVTQLIEFKYGKRFTTGIGWAQVTAIAATITLGTSDSVANAECS